MSRTSFNEATDPQSYAIWYREVGHDAQVGPNIDAYDTWTHRMACNTFHCASVAAGQRALSSVTRAALAAFLSRAVFLAARRRATSSRRVRIHAWPVKRKKITIPRTPQGRDGRLGMLTGGCLVKTRVEKTQD